MKWEGIFRWEFSGREFSGGNSLGGSFTRENFPGFKIRWVKVSCQPTNSKIFRNLNNFINMSVRAAAVVAVAAKINNKKVGAKPNKRRI